MAMTLGPAPTVTPDATRPSTHGLAAAEVLIVAMSRVAAAQLAM
jgi:hypothetical protein